jgi:hypothetical protein
MNGKSVLSGCIAGNDSMEIDTSGWAHAVYTMELMNMQTQALEYRKLLK